MKSFSAFSGFLAIFAGFYRVFESSLLCFALLSVDCSLFMCVGILCLKKKCDVYCTVDYGSVAILTKRCFMGEYYLHVGLQMF